MSKLFSRKIQFIVGEEILMGEYLTKVRDVKPQLLFLHGAGHANKERAKPMAEAIVEETGIGAFLLDFSGHGESTGELSASSLKKRTQEADAAWQFMASDKPLAIFAFSMGGHIALELLATSEIESLILFYPGIYSRHAFDLPFDHRFTEEIRKDKSWRDASVFDNLSSFKGNLLIIYGANDTVVPEEVVNLALDAATKAASKELYVIQGVPHLLLPTVYGNPDLKRRVVEKISTMLAPLFTDRTRV